MSLRAVPVCMNCGRPTEVSISCTKCYLICCATCFSFRSDIFNAAAARDNNGTPVAENRPCPKCTDSNNNTTPAIDSSVVIKTEPDDPVDQLSTQTETARGLCELHHKDCKLFCMQCNVAICGSCINEGQLHELHHIDNFSIVYREKLSELNSKLDQAKKSIEALGSRTAVCGWNLDLLEKEEAVVLKEIDAVAESSKLKVTRQTSIRKERLRAQLQIPNVRERAMSQLRDTVNVHSADDFMKNLSKLDQICTKLVTTPAPDGIPLETVDDIDCDLVPAYRFERFTLIGILQQENYNNTFLLSASFDVVWKVTVMKSEKVQLQLSPSDPEHLKFPHKLVVVIPHTDSAKEIRQTFELKDNCTVFDVVEVTQLVALEFNRDSEDLVIKIGIRPVNTVIENRLLSYQYELLKIKLRGTEQNLKTSEMKLTAITGKVDYNHFVLRFTLKINKFSKHLDKGSLHLIDDADRRWRLNLYPANDIGVYLELLQGPGTNCSYFVELKHEDPAKTVLKSVPHVYIGETNESGFKCFLKWNQLMNDAGFYPEGVLRFRFGVRPLPTWSDKTMQKA